MKKISSIILATVIAASMIAGCSSEASAPSESSVATSGLTEATAADPYATEPTTPQTFRDVYGDQLLNYLDHQYYFDGQTISVFESNFYFINSFLDLSNYANMGYYPMTNTMYIDLAAACESADYATYGDYYLYYAEHELLYSLIVAARADAEGVKLSDDTQADIDAMFDNIRNGSAASSGMTLDEYFQLYYGPGMDEATFRQVLERYYLVYAYMDEYAKNYQFEESEMYPNIRYALFYAPETASQEDKDSALGYAQEMLDACASIDDITGLAEAGQETGIVYDQGDISVPIGKTVADFEAWAHGEDRYEGEMDIIYAPEYGYFVVGYLGLIGDSQVAMDALSAEVEAEIEGEVHEFYTNDVYNPAPAGPTATAIPTNIADGLSFDAAPTGAAQPAAGTTTQTGAPMSTADVLVVVFITLAAVAVIAVVIILIFYALKNGKGGDDNNTTSRPSPRNYNDDDFGDEDEVDAFFENMKKNESSDEEPEDYEEEEEKPAPSKNQSQNKNSSGNKNQGNKNQGNKGSNGGNKGSNNGNKNNSNRNNNNRNSSKKKNNKKKH